ncbi:MAG TPA: right-handed parallel beta-helix repeat-containing protein, partial [Actinomycetota bacterium]|nr:right-handed parallel beta-helix repeat-containing protein [Actinomycetota bacterium]
MRRRLRAVVLLSIPLALALPVSPARGTDHEGDREVEMIDNVFVPRIVRIPVGGTVRWTNGGRALHDVTSDDGSFATPDLRPGDSAVEVFPTEGAFPYFCSIHGAPGVGMTGLVLVGDAPIPGGASDVGPGRETPPTLPGDEVRVPQDAPTIQAAVDAAEPGGLVLISPGVYEEAVVVTTPFLTIRGLDRNGVILEGGFALDNGIAVIEADGVAIENLTARHYLVNGFLWSGVFGYRGSYLTAFNDGEYGLFAYDSVYGQFDHSYASGHPDSGFYIGQCHPCHAVITDVLAERNAIGYSGTNAGGDLFVVNSEWRNNLAGIVPNTLDSELLAPQHDALIAGNWVHDNHNDEAPSFDLEYPSLGIGILVNGGRDNLVTQNLVEDHETFGIALLPSPDEHVWLTQGNRIRDNLVRGSGEADLVLGAPSAGGDCFSGNDFTTSLPPAIEWRAGCSSPLARIPGGSVGAVLGPLERYLEAALGDVDVGDWRSQPPPPDQEQMPGAESAPPDPAIAETAVPEPVRIRDARMLDVPASPKVSQEVTVLGISLATSWWGVLIGLYAYVLPLILYSAWVSIALWDLVRQEAVPNRTRILWMLVVLVVPLAGPIAY